MICEKHPMSSLMSTPSPLFYICKECLTEEIQAPLFSAIAALKSECQRYSDKVFMGSKEKEELPLEPKPFDPTKPAQQRNGKAARIICTDAIIYWDGIIQPILALCMGSDGEEEALSFHSDGRYYNDKVCSIDLINIRD